MDLDGLTDYCLAKPGASAEHPFGPGALVMKVGGKMFAIILEDEEAPAISLKCEPEMVPVLRDSFPDVAPGYHLNKKHWNTVAITGSIPDSQIRDWVDDSYDLVFEKLPKRVRATLDRISKL